MTLRYPEPAIGALIFNSKGEILLITGKKFSYKYVIPGGHLEIGEQFEDALRREVKEETGLEVFDIVLLGVQNVIYNKYYSKRKHFIYIDFICKTRSTNVRLNEESESFIWIKPVDALHEQLDPYTKKLIQEYLKDKKSKYRQQILYNYIKDNN